MSKVITRYLRYIDELYQLVENNIDLTKVDKSTTRKDSQKV